MRYLGLEFGSAAQLSKRPGSVWNCLWGNALKRSPGIIRKSTVSYPGPGFISSATWPSLPKKHYKYNGLKLNQTKRQIVLHIYEITDCIFQCLSFLLYNMIEHCGYWWIISLAVQLVGVGPVFD